MATLTTISNLFKCIKLGGYYQISAGGKQFYVACFCSVDDYGTVPPTIIIWNMTDDSSVVFAETGTHGDFGVYPVTQLTNGHIAVLASKTYAGYLYEIDLLNLSMVFSHVLPAKSSYLFSGPGNYIGVGSGTGTGAQYVSWCDFGGTNWVDHLITNFANGMYVRGCYVQSATDTFTYAYAHEYNSNKVIAVRTDTDTETVLIDATDGYDAASLCLVTLDGGVTRNVYLKCTTPGTDWFIVDGLVMTPTAAPTDAQQEWNYEELFKSDVYPVDLTNLMPTEAGESTLGYTRATVNYTETVTGALPDYGVVRLLSKPWGDGKCLTQVGSSYGSINRFDPITETGEFLGYTGLRNPYALDWASNLDLGVLSGYDKALMVYDVDSSWTLAPGADEFSALINPYMVPRTGQSAAYDHFNHTLVGAIDKKIYMCSGGGDELYWYDPVTETWGELDLGTAYGLNDCDIMHICLIRGGHAIAISSRDQDAAGGDWVGRLRIFDVLSQTITKAMTITAPNATANLVDLGVMVEVGDSLTDNGHIICVRGNLASDSYSWRINTHAIMPTAVVWEAAITGNAFNLVTTGTNEYCKLEIAPDGNVYLMVGTSLKYIDVATGVMSAAVTITGGSIPAASELRWIGSNLYAHGASGDKNIYKIAGI